MPLKPKFLTGILFILVLSVTITVSMVLGVWKIEGRGERGEFRRGRTPNATSTNPNEQTIFDWCFQNQASPECVLSTLGLGFDDREKTVTEISKSKGITPQKMEEMLHGCVGNGSQSEQGGENTEQGNDND